MSYSSNHTSISSSAFVSATGNIDGSVAAANARPSSTQAGSNISPPLALPSRGQGYGVNTSMSGRATLPQAETPSQSPYQTASFGAPPSQASASPAGGSGGRGTWLGSHGSALRSGGRTSRLGDETRYGEASTVRSNAWPGSFYHDALAEFPQTGSNQGSTSTKPASAAGAPEQAFANELFLSAQSSIASDLSGMPDGELDVSDHGNPWDISSEGSGGRQPRPAGGSENRAWSSSSVSSLTTIGSGLTDLPNLEYSTGDSGHLEISSESSWGSQAQLAAENMLGLAPSRSASARMSNSPRASIQGRDEFGGSGHLVFSSTSSEGATPVAPAQPVESAVDQAYRAAEQSISAAYWDHGTFRSGYNNVKTAMSDAGSIDVGRLGSLLSREEEAIRSAYGRTKWQALTMDHGVDSFTTSRIQNSRDRTLSWIKSEQRSMGLPSKRSSLQRIGSWATKTFSNTGGRPTVPAPLMDAIAEGDESA